MSICPLNGLIPKWHVTADTPMLHRSLNISIYFLSCSTHSVPTSPPPSPPQRLAQAGERTEGQFLHHDISLGKTQKESGRRNDLPINKCRLVLTGFPSCSLEHSFAIFSVSPLQFLLNTPNKESACGPCFAHVIFLLKHSQCGWSGGSVVKSACSCRGPGFVSQQSHGVVHNHL